MKTLTEYLNEEITVNEGFFGALKEFGKQLKATKKVIVAIRDEFAGKVKENPDLTVQDYLDWVQDKFWNEIKDFEELDPKILLKSYLDGQEEQFKKTGFSKTDKFIDCYKFNK